MSNAIRDKINNGFQLLIFDTHAKLLELSHGRTDTVYYVKADENNSNQPVSYLWNSTTPTILSQVVEDLNLVDGKINFPTTGDVDDLYVDTKTNFIFEWVDTIGYRFLCEVSSVISQLMQEVLVKYSHQSVPDTGISLNIIYKIGFDGRTFVQAGNVKVYKDIYIIKEKFSPVDGSDWNDIFGDYTPPSVPVISQDDKDYMVRTMFDFDRDGRVDYAADSAKFGGKTPSYYDNRFNKLVQVGTTAPSDLTGLQWWVKKI